MNETAGPGLKNDNPGGITGDVPLEYPRPPWGKRFLAFTVDALLASGPLALAACFVLTPLIGMMAYLELPSLFDHEAVITAAMAVFYISIPWFLFFSLCRDGFGGRSPGKRLCGLAVIDQRDGSRCTMSKSLVRNVLFVLIALFHWFIPLIGFLALLVEPLAIITSPLGLRFGDRWAETQVVEITGIKK